MNPLKVVFFCILGTLAGCETNPSTTTAASGAPTRDPTREALSEGERAYRADDDARALTLLLPLAKSGNLTAQQFVARIYSRGKGVPINHTESCNWWEAATLQNDPRAASNYGICFETGKGRAKSDATAVKWYQQSADAGIAYGMYNLALMHEYGRGVPQSFDRAAEWFTRALAAKLSTGDNVDAQRHLKRSMNHVNHAKGDPQASFDLAIDLMNGHAPEVKDQARAVAAMRQAATRGNSPEAWFIYGSWLHGGMGGIPSDMPQAGVWIKKASDTGHEAARIRYANILLCGIGVAKDAAGGERLLRSTVASGSWLAMSELSQWYATAACGFKKDAALSSEWRAKADAAQLKALK
jgi:uncharacterized protein